MRLGISVTSSYPDVGPDVAVARLLARAVVAAEAGLEHLTVGDHHSSATNYVQNVPIIGRITADWPSNRPIGLLFILPLWHPVIAAEQIGTLAALTESPFIVQTGIGSRQGEFAAMGADLRTRGRRTDEAIRVMKDLLAGERVESEEFGLSEAVIAPRPPRPVEWWIGSGPGEVPLRRAAREGDAWYADPRLTAEELSVAAARYRELCAEHGTTPRVALRRDILVTDDDATGLSRGRQLVDAGYRGLNEEQLIFGGVERVAERMATLADLGVDDMVVRTMAVDQPTALRSIELLAQVRTRLG